MPASPAGDFPGLPRSAVLALWLQAERPAPGVVVRCVQGDDEPHTVTGLPGFGEIDAGLKDLVEAWTAGTREVVALQPAAGDPAGVPAAATTAATTAGECVAVTTAAGSWVAVPQVTTFGSALEPGHLVQWQVLAVPPWSTAVAGALGSLADAERELRTSLVTATEALDAIDVARWRDDAADAIEAVRTSSTESWPVPPLDGRRARVLQLATRLLAIVDLATDDDGGAVNLWQVDQRSTALREVERTARHALAAATYARVP
ncbi:hypothetical protein Xcel_1426 [Xylanimonas cellulosilytica DSM 15894]|uniref:Uncharacterized protein n=1 Tax=Xylanimonas cellulosilytica (strain DSM 15894 / JCM 12276 / CECT 5975 / KCTC 9989 / LMG 20990 / NBRC 107835 / XIL07) TaxID=446471 RepID=D1BRW5_XYLCX|nr:hypothetical protein [Xylanimonas cellulosilytica]ACZ30457.1 hypothetical protein Xcel_1426 [Xylanimonas cellulosilytica DSM 15894]